MPELTARGLYNDVKSMKCADILNTDNLKNLSSLICGNKTYDMTLSITGN